MNQLSLQEAKDKIYELFDVTEEMVNSRSRKREISDARHCVWYVMYHRGYSKTQIAKMFNVDHATVIHGIRNTLTFHQSEMEPLIKCESNKDMCELSMMEGIDRAWLSEKLNIHRTTLNRKARGESQFTVNEMKSAINALQGLVDKINFKIKTIENGIS